MLSFILVLFSFTSCLGFLFKELYPGPNDTLSNQDFPSEENPINFGDFCGNPGEYDFYYLTYGKGKDKGSIVVCKRQVNIATTPYEVFRISNYNGTLKLAFIYPLPPNTPNGILCETDAKDYLVYKVEKT